MRTYPRFFVTPKGERAVRNGHPWVYAEEITGTDGEYGNGDLVDVMSDRDRYLGTGFVNDHSKIRVRIISTNTNDRFDAAFWERRLRYALEYRRTVMCEEDFRCCRLIFGEADMFPGFIVDRFDDLLVAQTLSLGMEQRKDMIFTLLLQVLADMGQEIRGLYERNDVRFRLLEGLEERKGWYVSPDLPEHGPAIAEILENGIRYFVDVENGQKTGFFLDQKYNRRAVARLAGGRKVLDCFTHTGSFALNAARGGASRVTAVDISADAVAMVGRNAALNGYEHVVQGMQANVFDLLTDLVDRHCHDYDYIILDPPAFTKSGTTVRNAARGYKQINLKAMKLLPRGGYLATCSCSHFMKDELFVEMLRDAAKDAHVCLRQVEARQQAPDHPYLWNVPETYYLKFYIFQVV